MRLHSQFGAESVAFNPATGRFQAAPDRRRYRAPGGRAGASLARFSCRGKRNGRGLGFLNQIQIQIHVAMLKDIYVGANGRSKLVRTRLREGVGDAAGVESFAGSKSFFSDSPSMVVLQRQDYSRRAPLFPYRRAPQPCRPVGTEGNNRVVFPGSNAKVKSPNQKARRLLFPLFRWRLCPVTMPKRYHTVLDGTKMRVQKPVPAIPTRCLLYPYGVGFYRIMSPKD